jgi:hypothetical protein
MSESGLVHLELELDPMSDPVEGWLLEDGGERVPFTGWLQLAAALERARLGAAPSAPLA